MSGLNPIDAALNPKGAAAAAAPRSANPIDAALGHSSAQTAPNTSSVASGGKQPLSLSGVGRDIAAGAAWTVQHPIDAVTNALGAVVDRPIQGLLSGKGRPLTLEEQDKAAQDVEDRFIDKRVQKLFPVVGAVGNFAAGTAIAPSTFIPGSWYARGAKALGITKAAEAVSKSGVGRGTKSLLESYPSLHGLTPEARQKAVGMKVSEEMKMAPLAKADADLIKLHKRAMKAGEQTTTPDYHLGEILPEPIRQRLLYEAYTYGDATMKLEAKRLGYKVQPGDRPLTVPGPPVAHGEPRPSGAVRPAAEQGELPLSQRSQVPNSRNPNVDQGPNRTTPLLVPGHPIAPGELRSGGPRATPETADQLSFAPQQTGQFPPPGHGFHGARETPTQPQRLEGPPNPSVDQQLLGQNPFRNPDLTRGPRGTVHEPGLDLSQGVKEVPPQRAQGPAVPKDPNEGILSYHVKDQYTPTYTKGRQAEHEPGFLDTGKTNPGSANFEKMQGPRPDDMLPIEKRIEMRIAKGRTAVTERLTIKRMVDEFGITEQEAKGLLEKQTLGRLDILKRASDLSKWALVSVNPIPHALNIATLAYLAGGEKGLWQMLVRAGEYMRGHQAEETLKEMEQFGAGQTNFAQHGEVLSKLTEHLPEKIDNFAQKVDKNTFQRVQGLLDTLDTAARATRWEELKRLHPDWDGYKLADAVRNEIGDYSGAGTSRLVKGLRAVGGEFPAWRMSIMPKAVLRSLVTNPARIQRYLRAVRSGDQQLPYDIDPGGPIAGTAKEVADPLGSFFSASTVGPGVNAAIRAYGSRLKPNDFNLAEDTANTLEGYVPFGPQIEATRNTFHSPVDSLPARLGLSAIGAYGKRRPSQREAIIEKIMQETGMDRYQATRASEVWFRR
jgi:hypothetical protein